MTKCCSDKSPKFKDLATQTKQHHLLRSCRLLLRIRSYWCTLAMPRPKHPARRRLGSCLTRTGWAWDRLSNQGKDAPKSLPSHMSSFSHPRRVPTKLGVGTLSADGGWRGYCGDILQGYCGQEDRLICSPQSLPSHLHLGHSHRVPRLIYVTAQKITHTQFKKMSPVWVLGGNVQPFVLSAPPIPIPIQYIYPRSRKVSN